MPKVKSSENRNARATVLEKSLQLRNVWTIHVDYPVLVINYELFFIIKFPDVQ